MPRDLPILVVALSGRALAASAARAGRRVVVLDAFDDADTVELAEASARVPVDEHWRLDKAALLEAAARLAPAPAGLVYGSGFERRPDLLARLAEGRRLCCNPPDRLARAKDPFAFAEVAARLGVPHPEVLTELPADPGRWLVKARGGAGGSHVRLAETVPALRDGDYVQRLVSGRAIGALCLGDGLRARLVGFSEQWAAPGPATAPFRYAGAVVPAALPPAVEQRLARAATALVEAFALIGLASVDFLVDEGSFHALEVNPRPGATIDVFDRAWGMSLFELHLRACAGELPGRLPDPAQAEASMVVFAETRLTVPFGLRWPDWIADRPRAGEVIGPGDPIATVLASAAAADEARSLARARAAGLPALLEDHMVARPA